MRRAVQIAALVVGASLLALIALPLLFDVNRFRPELESMLATALGREVKVGKLGLSLLTHSVSAEDLSIGDDPAFGTEPFLRAKSLLVGVEVLPLIFSRSLEVTTLALEQPEIVLVQDANGRWNFSSLSKESEPAPHPGGGPATSQTVSVAKLEVKDGRLSVSHARASARAQVYDRVQITVLDFSPSSEFPVKVSANLPGGGKLALDAKAGPIDPTDAAATPLQAKLEISGLNLAAAGFVDPSTGIAGLADFDGALKSDGHELRTSGRLKIARLQLTKKGSPAGRPVEAKYTTVFDLQKRIGSVTEADVATGKAVTKLSGSYQVRGDSTVLNLAISADQMPVDDLAPLLPALGVVLPAGSSLQGGTLSASLAVVGPLDKPVISGPIRLADTKIVGFDLGARMSAIAALSGIHTGPNTSIQNFSAEARVAPDGVRTQKISLIVGGLGSVTGNGTINPAGALDFKMLANLAGASGVGLPQLLGSTSIPFSIKGTAADPKFVPDVGDMVERGVTGALKSLQQKNQKNQRGSSPFDALGDLLRKRKK